MAAAAHGTDPISPKRATGNGEGADALRQSKSGEVLAKVSRTASSTCGTAVRVPSPPSMRHSVTSLDSAKAEHTGVALTCDQPAQEVPQPEEVPETVQINVTEPPRAIPDPIVAPAQVAALSPERPLMATPLSPRTKTARWWAACFACSTDSGQDDDPSQSHGRKPRQSSHAGAPASPAAPNLLDLKMRDDVVGASSPSGAVGVRQQACDQAAVGTSSGARAGPPAPGKGKAGANGRPSQDRVVSVLSSIDATQPSFGIKARYDDRPSDRSELPDISMQAAELRAVGAEATSRASLPHNETGVPDEHGLERHSVERSTFDAERYTGAKAGAQAAISQAGSSQPRDSPGQGHPSAPASQASSLRASRSDAAACRVGEPTVVPSSATTADCPKSIPSGSADSTLDVPASQPISTTATPQLIASLDAMRQLPLSDILASLSSTLSHNSGSGPSTRPDIPDVSASQRKTTTQEAGSTRSSRLRTTSSARTSPNSIKVAATAALHATQAGGVTKRRSGTGDALLKSLSSHRSGVAAGGVRPPSTITTGKPRQLTHSVAGKPTTVPVWITNSQRMQSYQPPWARASTGNGSAASATASDSPTRRSLAASPVPSPRGAKSLMYVRASQQVDASRLATNSPSNRHRVHGSPISAHGNGASTSSFRPLGASVTSSVLLQSSPHAPSAGATHSMPARYSAAAGQDSAASSPQKTPAPAGSHGSDIRTQHSLFSVSSLHVSASAAPQLPSSTFVSLTQLLHQASGNGGVEHLTHAVSLDEDGVVYEHLSLGPGTPSLQTSAFAGSSPTTPESKLRPSQPGNTAWEVKSGAGHLAASGSSLTRMVLNQFGPVKGTTSTPDALAAHEPGSGASQDDEPYLSSRMEELEEMRLASCVPGAGASTINVRVMAGQQAATTASSPFRPQESRIVLFGLGGGAGGASARWADPPDEVTPARTGDLQATDRRTSDDNAGGLAPPRDLPATSEELREQESGPPVAAEHDQDWLTNRDRASVMSNGFDTVRLPPAPVALSQLAAGVSSVGQGTSGVATPTGSQKGSPGRGLNSWTPAALNAYEATLSNVQHILDTGDQEAAEVLSNL